MKREPLTILNDLNEQDVDGVLIASTEIKKEHREAQYRKKSDRKR